MQVIITAKLVNTWGWILSQKDRRSNFCIVLASQLFKKMFLSRKYVLIGKIGQNVANLKSGLILHRVFEKISRIFAVCTIFLFGRVELQ